MVQVILAGFVVIMSVFFSSANFNGSSSSSPATSSQTSDYLVNSPGVAPEQGSDFVASIVKEEINKNAPVDDVIEHQDSAPVPEPATLLLFGPALAGLVMLRKKKK